MWKYEGIVVEELIDDFYVVVFGIGGIDFVLNKCKCVMVGLDEYDVR